MHRHSMGSAPNYTTPALIMGGINLFWVMLLLWQAVGFIVALMLAMGINYLIDRKSVRQR